MSYCCEEELQLKVVFKMSQPHDGHHASSHFGNPIWFVLPKGLKPLALSNSFEQSLVVNFRKLKGNDTPNFLSFIWLRQAVDSLFESHNMVKALIDDLHFPASVWDEKWIQFYLDDSVKLLDVCIVLISEISRIEQHGILLRYALHILDFSSTPPCSPEKLKRAAGALHDWTQKLHSSSPKLENTPAFLGLIGAFSLPKVKKSGKKVVMRALYAVKVEMIFVCSVLMAVLSGCSKTLIDLQVSHDFLWAEAFNDLQATVNRELKSRLSFGKPVLLKELDEVNVCARNLHDMVIGLDNRIDGSEKETDSVVVEEARRRCQKPILELAKGSKSLAQELELLGMQLNDLFELVMSGRDALLSSLRASYTNGRKLKS